MREGQWAMLCARLTDGVCEMDAYHYAGLRLDSARECNREVNRWLDRDAWRRFQYIQAITRGAQARADQEHPHRY